MQDKEGKKQTFLFCCQIGVQRVNELDKKGQSLADRAVAFINSLKHTKGVWYGKNFELLPWQDKIVRDIFGTLKPNGYRQYNTAYVEIPKKQGKSELAAAIALYLTCGDGEYGAEVYGCAADRQQASIVFDVAVEMINVIPKNRGTTHSEITVFFMEFFLIKKIAALITKSKTIGKIL